MGEKKFGTIITNEGAALIAECILCGDVLPITTAAAGDGGGTYYEPSADQTALKNECWRGEIAGFTLSEYAPNMLDVKIIIDDEAGGFTIREMGLFTDDGVMVAVCNTPDTEKIAITGGMPGRLTMVMHIIVADSSAVEIVVNPELDTVTADQLKSTILSHDSDPNSHADIRALALNSMQKGEVYTKSESDAETASAIADHNTNANAHGSILGSLSRLEGEIETLNLKYSTNITANAFSVTFETIDELSVAGVYNTERGTVDF